MRRCPWCGGEMEWTLYQEDLSFYYLICKERCQHRRCQTCGVNIHRGSKDDPNYYDEAGNATCYIQNYYDADSEWQENVGHQP